MIKKNYSKYLINSESTMKNAIKKLNFLVPKFCLVVNDNRSFLGVLTDGDIRRGLLKNYTINDKIINIINRKTIITKTKLSRSKINHILKNKEINCLPLINNSKKILDVYISNEYETKNYLDYKMLIMAGGKGVRLRPLTKNTPKPLLIVNGKPIIEHIILSAKKQGINKFIISIHYLGHKIKKYLGNGKKLGVNIKYINEKMPLGTAGSLYLLKKFNKPLIVSNADIISNIDFQELINYHKKLKSIITVTAINISEKNQYGKIIFKKNKLLKIEEKKENKNLINAGIYVLSPKIKTFLIKKEYKDMTDLISKVVKSSNKVHIFPIFESWLDYGLKKNIKRHYY